MLGGIRYIGVQGGMHADPPTGYCLARCARIIFNIIMGSPMQAIGAAEETGQGNARGDVSTRGGLEVRRAWGMGSRKARVMAWA